MIKSIGSYIQVGPTSSSITWYCHTRQVMVLTFGDGVVYALDALTGARLDEPRFRSAVRPFTDIGYSTPLMRLRFRWESRWRVFRRICDDIVATGVCTIPGLVHLVRFGHGASLYRVGDQKKILWIVDLDDEDSVYSENPRNTLRGMLARAWAYRVAGDERLASVSRNGITVDPIMMDAKIQGDSVSWVRPELLSSRHASLLGIDSTHLDARSAIHAVLEHTNHPTHLPQTDAQKDPTMRDETELITFWERDTLTLKLYKGDVRSRYPAFGRHPTYPAPIVEFLRMVEEAADDSRQPIVVGRGPIAWGCRGLYQMTHLGWAETSSTTGLGRGSQRARGIAIRWWTYTVAEDRRFASRELTRSDGIRIAFNPVLGEVAWSKDGESWDVALVGVGDDPLLTLDDDSPVWRLASQLGVDVIPGINSHALFRAVVESPPQGSGPWRDWTEPTRHQHHEVESDSRTPETRTNDEVVMTDDTAHEPEQDDSFTPKNLVMTMDVETEEGVSDDGAWTITVRCTPTLAIRSGLPTDVSTCDVVSGIRSDLVDLIGSIEEWAATDPTDWDALAALRSDLVDICDATWSAYRSASDDEVGASLRTIHTELQVACRTLESSVANESLYSVRALRTRLRMVDDQLWEEIIFQAPTD